MQVGRGVGGHSEAWNLERMSVRLVAGDVEAAHVGLSDVAPSLEVVVDHPEHLKHVAARVGALMTGHATVELEHFVTAPLLFGKGGLVAGQPLVEAAVRRSEGALELSERILDVVPSDAIRIGRLEQRRILLVLVQLAKHVRPQACHFHGRLDGAIHLLGQVIGASVPELLEVQV